MIILGRTHPISRNSAACLLIDGHLVAFAEEERFTRVKQARRLPPQESIDFCLRQAGLKPRDIDASAIGFERAAPEDVSAEPTRPPAEGGSAHLLAAIEREMRAEHRLAEREIRPYGAHHYYDHHHAHAASAFQPSGFPEANVISLDGWGGRLSGLLGFQRRGEALQVIAEIGPPNSWGAVYAVVTQQLGFRPHSAEGKTMGLAAYGVPDDQLLPDWCDELFGLPDARRYLDYVSHHISPRHPLEPLTKSHQNLAATLQYYYERSLVKIGRFLGDRTGSRNFVLAGGVALNCAGNGRLAAQDCVDRIFVQPASHDAGTALGAAILAHEELTGRRPCVDFDHAYWGPDYSDGDIRAVLRSDNITHHEVDPVEAATSALLDNRAIGWFQGRAEVGPRALGARSILANAAHRASHDRVNRVKGREGWRPLAPSVSEERFFDLFAMRHLSPFMLLAGGVRENWRARVPAVVHVDGSARPQAVSGKTNPVFHRLLSTLDARTEVPAVLNTSFNLQDEPLVNSPEHALACFFRSELDALVIGTFLVEKGAQRSVD